MIYKIALLHALSFGWMMKIVSWLSQAPVFLLWKSDFTSWSGHHLPFMVWSCCFRLRENNLFPWTFSNVNVPIAPPYPFGFGCCALKWKWRPIEISEKTILHFYRLPDSYKQTASQLIECLAAMSDKKRKLPSINLLELGAHHLYLWRQPQLFFWKLKKKKWSWKSWQFFCVKLMPNIIAILCWVR